MTLYFSLLLCSLDPLSCAESMRKNSSMLNLTGEIVDVKSISDNPRGVSFRIHYRFKFMNISDQRILLFKEGIWHEYTIVSTTEEESLSWKPVKMTSHGPSLDDSQEWISLRKRLDKNIPPDELLLVLEPGQDWYFECEEVLLFSRDSRYLTQGEKSWDFISQYEQLFLRSRMIVWPFNIEPKRDRDNPKFGKKLRNRWQKFGTLWLEDITSAPIPIRLPRTLE